MLTIYQDFNKLLSETRDLTVREVRSMRTDIDMRVLTSFEIGHSPGSHQGAGGRDETPVRARRQNRVHRRDTMNVNVPTDCASSADVAVKHTEPPQAL